MDSSDVSNAGIVWSGLLTAVLAYMGYNAKRRDDAIDANAKAVSDLALKTAETYATNSNVNLLFTATNQTNKDAIARVEKRIDETNATIVKQSDKIDKVGESITQFQTSVMHELAKKT